MYHSEHFSKIGIYTSTIVTKICRNLILLHFYHHFLEMINKQWILMDFSSIADTHDNKTCLQTYLHLKTSLNVY